VANSVIEPTQEEITQAIANKKHLNSLLDKVLQRERIRQGFSSTSKDGEANTEASLLDPIVQAQVEAALKA